MNLLVDELSVILKKRIGNIQFNTDYRIGIMFEQLMQNRRIDERHKAMCALKLYYPDLSQITDYEKAFDDIIWFYLCGKEETKKANKKSSKSSDIRQTRIFDYDYDDGYIYSAFLQQYGIDLQDIKYLHWWKFKSLFYGLNEDTKIVEIMGYRSMDLKQIKDKEERKRYRKLKDLYRLPDMRSELEKEEDIGSAMW